MNRNERNRKIMKLKIYLNDDFNRYVIPETF